MKQSERTDLTRTRIREAFINLVESKGFGNLTVSDLTREASVSRGTFYVHYADKHELLASIEHDLRANITKIIKDDIAATIEVHSINDASSTSPNEELSDNLYNLFNHALYYIDQKRHTMKVLMSPNGDPQFFDEIKNVIDDTFAQQLQSGNGYFSDTLPIDYTKEIVVNNVVYLVRHWINKTHPESTEDFAKILMQSRFLAPNDLIIFSKA
ncbi:transcriptional regulator [Weissella oryzae SG25]|uniref:Transcriptional regulator n=1 Tax=Weissella oryzae (strain DSM 25784 / JCM 18191 / LMG 30913 / SG25) TaxID=1329250 RepID=A0A069CX55_WEIOS|nr:TetR/AcrR family transcriptional regulator [Weissella oryzae]GAK31763.1 transcriptional regulator [Weissella oryzae SG25]